MSGLGAISQIPVIKGFFALSLGPCLLDFEFVLAIECREVEESGKKWEKDHFGCQGKDHVFTGSHALNLDAKGRLAIPTRFREKLNASCSGRVIITCHPYDRCLALYPEPRWDEVAATVASLSDADTAVRALKRRFLGQAVDLELDGSGRILIPPELRTMAELDKAVMLVGQVSRFEVWCAEGWEAQQQQDLSGALPEEARSLSF